MRKRTLLVWFLAAALLVTSASLAATGPAAAHPLNAMLSAYVLDWRGLSGGGGSSSSGDYRLSGAVGPAASGFMQGGSYRLAGGFWGDMPYQEDDQSYPLYLPMVLKGP